MENNLKKSAAALFESLEIFTLEKYPEDYSFVQEKLSGAYRALAEIKDREENLRKAKEADIEASRY